MAGLDRGSGGVALLAYAIHYLPFEPFRVAGESGVRRPVSAAILAIFAGAIAGNLLPVGKAVLEGAKHVARRAIPLTIVLTGATLSFANAQAAGLRACAVIVATMTACAGRGVDVRKDIRRVAAHQYFDRRGNGHLRQQRHYRGGAVDRRRGSDVMLSMGAINVLGLVLMFVSPLLGAAIGFNDEGYGVWAGSTLHAVPQAVAAGFAFSVNARAAWRRW